MGYVQRLSDFIFLGKILSWEIVLEKCHFTAMKVFFPNHSSILFGEKYFHGSQMTLFINKSHESIFPQNIKSDNICKHGEKYFHGSEMPFSKIISHESIFPQNRKSHNLCTYPIIIHAPISFSTPSKHCRPL